VPELSWSLRQRGIKSLMILSDDRQIPWELIKPFRADPLTGAILSEDGFWGESYALAHWLRGRPPASRFSVTRVLGIAPTSGGAVRGSLEPSEFPASGAETAASGDMTRIDAISAPMGSSADPPASASISAQPAAPLEQPVQGLGIASLGPVQRSPPGSTGLRRVHRRALAGFRPCGPGVRSSAL
jgi:hypothetical protein